MSLEVVNETQNSLVALVCQSAMECLALALLKCMRVCCTLLQVAVLISPSPQPMLVAPKVSHSMGQAFVTGLGLGSSVPGFLRWTGRLALQSYSQPVMANCPCQGAMWNDGMWR